MRSDNNITLFIAFDRVNLLSKRASRFGSSSLCDRDGMGLILFSLFPGFECGFILFPVKKQCYCRHRQLPSSLSGESPFNRESCVTPFQGHWL